MREILFKAIAVNPHYGWVTGSCCYEFETHYIVQPCGTKYAVHSETVCQYTGLKDRNGAMIFEGDNLIFTEKRDWIKFNSGNAVFVDGLGSCGCCFDEFDGSGFAIQSSCGFYYATCIDEYWELTGKNIHDK